MNAMDNMERFGRQFWDERYATHEHLWSGRPNAQLVAHAEDLRPGRALDVGCGEGGDAIWLARQGWTVTGTDISPVALGRAADHATRAGSTIAARTQWREVDLFADAFQPFDGCELVSSQYLHMPAPVRDRALERLAAAVLPGGHLLVVSHHPSDLNIPGLRPNVPDMFYAATELADRLDPSRWEILAADAPSRSETGPDGAPVTVHDAVLHARLRRE